MDNLDLKLTNVAEDDLEFTILLPLFPTCGIIGSRRLVYS